MHNTSKQEQIFLADKLYAGHSHVKTLEKKRKEEEFEYSRIVARKDAAYFKLCKYGVAMLLLVIVLIGLSCVVGGTVNEVVRLKWSSSEDGLTVLYGVLTIVLLVIGCVWLGIKVFRLIRMLKELKEQEMIFGAKLSFTQTKLEECRAELEDLLRKQEEQNARQ